MSHEHTRQGFTEMQMVSEEVVESTWRHVESLDPGSARRLMEEAAERQPAPLAYVMASTAHSRADVQALAVYLYYVVLQMFEASVTKPMKKVKISRVEFHAERNDSLFERLAPADERFLERVAGVESSTQPFVLRYIIEALLEDSDPDVSLAEEESGLLFLTLKTVVDVLDDASHTPTK